VSEEANVIHYHPVLSTNVSYRCNVIMSIQPLAAIRNKLLID